MKENNSIRSPLSRARGLGSAKSGTHHWIMQRISAIALIILSAWFLSCTNCMATSDHDSLLVWLQEPFVAIAMLLFTLAVFYHAWLGLQVVIEDYVHKPMTRFLTLLLVRFSFIVMAVMCVFSVLAVMAGIDL